MVDENIKVEKHTLRKIILRKVKLHEIKAKFKIIISIIISIHTNIYKAYAHVKCTIEKKTL